MHRKNARFARAPRANRHHHNQKGEKDAEACKEGHRLGIVQWLARACRKQPISPI
jgi:hypothetical protein